MSASGSFPQASCVAPVVKASKSRKATVFVLLLLAALPTAWHFRAPILTGMAKVWEVNDTPATSDAIIILGGGLNTRSFDAVKLYQDHLAPKVLLAETKISPAAELGVLKRETDASKEVLMKLGVPEADIATFGKDVTSTYEEACGLRDYMLSTGIKRIIIPTDFTHSRRVKWLMRHVLPADSQIIVVASSSLYYDHSNWWQREEGVMAFQNELIKNIYYRLKY